MTRPSLPPQLIEKETHLLRAFEVIADSLGETPAQAEANFRMLPFDLRNAPAFFDKLTKLWRYQYGEPYGSLPEGKVIFGTPQCPEVEILYRAISFIQRHLPNTKIVEFLDRLSDRAKHLDTLAELSPITRLTVAARVSHEPPGVACGQRCIDWLIEPSTRLPTVLLEVKHRIRDVIDMATRSIPALSAGSREMLPPAHDVSALFRDTIDKFAPANPSERLQGAWIFCPVKQIRRDVERYFGDLDPTRLHFALLTNWHQYVAGLWRIEAHHQYILDMFNVTESNDFYMNGDEAA